MTWYAYKHYFDWFNMVQLPTISFWWKVIRNLAIKYPKFKATSFIRSWSIVDLLWYSAVAFNQTFSARWRQEGNFTTLIRKTGQFSKFWTWDSEQTLVKNWPLSSRIILAASSFKFCKWPFLQVTSFSLQ